MDKPESKIITCPHCGKQFSKDDLRRHCSNCFACTGCERYLCESCDEVIEVIPIRPMNYRRPSQTK